MERFVFQVPLRVLFVLCFWYDNTKNRILQTRKNKTQTTKW